MTILHVVEHREILHIPGPGQQHDMDVTFMHVASSREKAVDWIKTKGEMKTGYFAVTSELLDDPGIATIDNELEFYDVAGNLLQEQPCSVDRRYVLSLKHTSPGDNALTFWGPNNRGYRLSLEDAGVYTEAEAKKIMDDSRYPVKDGPVVYNAIALPAGHVNRLGKTIVPFDGTILTELGVLEHWRNWSKHAK